jgi:hypothetical protein
LVDSEFIVQSEILQKREDAIRRDKETKGSQAAQETASIQREQATKTKANRVRQRQVTSWL